MHPLVTGKPTDPLDCAIYLTGQDGGPIGFVRKDGSVWVRTPQGIMKATPEQAVAFYVLAAQELGWVSQQLPENTRIEPGTFLFKNTHSKETLP